MKTVGIDCRFAAEYAGLGTYTRSLVTALLRRGDPVRYVLFVRSSEESWLRALRGNEFMVIPAPFGHYSVAEQMSLPRLLRASACDFLFASHFNVPLWCPVPFACTVHDLILHRYPNHVGLTRRLAYRYLFARSVRRARFIVTVSHATRRELISFYGESVGGKARTVYPGLPEGFPSLQGGTVSAAPPTGMRPYLLYVGNCKEHKNVPLLLTAYRASGVAATHDLLLLTGGKESLSLSLPAGARIAGEVPFDRLPALYGAASGFVSASLAEGFGFPLIEAMASRCPVLATNCGSLPEVCGGHALLVEPTLPSLTEGLQRLVTDGSLRSSTRLEAAALHAHSFRWQRTAEEISRLLLAAI